MPTTPKLALPYPVPSDPADIPADMQRLAVRLDDVSGTASGLATLGSDGKVPAAQLPAPVPVGGKTTVSAWSGGPPTSPAPVDGDQWIATGVDSSGMAWHFVYVAAATYKWVFIGGPWRGVAVEGAQTYASTAYGDLATVLSLPLGRGGFWQFRWGARCTASSGVSTFITYALSGGTGFGPNDAQAGMMGNSSGVAGYVDLQLERTEIFGSPVVAGTTITTKHRTNLNGQTVTYANRYLAVQPVAIL